MTDRRGSRLLAVLLAAWLAAMLQPCLAAAETLAPAGHCDHAQNPEHAASCPGMQAVDCESDADWQADPPRGAIPPRVAVFVAPVDLATGTVTAAPAPPGTGPPPRIRFCKLRN